MHIPHLHALKALGDPALFAQAQLGDRGTCTVWLDDQLNPGADNLCHLAVDPVGEIGNERLVAWNMTGPLRQSHLNQIGD